MSLEVSIRKKAGDFLLETEFTTRGGVLGLLGASGCGKSMTLKCIAGIERPDEGRIVLNGVTLYDSARHIDLPPQKRRVGYLFQNYALFPNMTVAQNIRCGLCREKDRAEKDKAVADMIRRMALTGLEHHRPSQLSGGQCQRTELARILVSRPEVLLLDEPFSALDAYLRLQLETEMKHILQEYGRDVILVSHSRDEIYRLCADALVMDDGQILGSGEIHELFRNPGSRRAAALTGCKNIAEAHRTGEHTVTVPEWGLELTTAESVREGLCAVGIRAHSFHVYKPDANGAQLPTNTARVRFVETVEEPFEWIHKFRYETAPDTSEPVWWRVGKEYRDAQLTDGRLPEALSVSPEKVMLLYR